MVTNNIGNFLHQADQASRYYYLSTRFDEEYRSLFPDKMQILMDERVLNDPEHYRLWRTDNDWVMLAGITVGQSDRLFEVYSSLMLTGSNLFNHDESASWGMLVRETLVNYAEIAFNVTLSFDFIEQSVLPRFSRKFSMRSEEGIHASVRILKGINLSHADDNQAQPQVLNLPRSLATLNSFESFYGPIKN